MIQVKEINKNRKAKFKRLLVEYVNNRIDATTLLKRSHIYKNLLGLAEQYIAHAKRDVLSCETQEEINDRIDEHVNFLLVFNKTFSHVAKCLNSVQKGRFSPEIEQKKETYFGSKMEVVITELGYTIDFPEERVKLYCSKKCVNDIQCELPRN